MDEVIAGAGSRPSDDRLFYPINDNSSRTSKDTTRRWCRTMPAPYSVAPEESVADAAIGPDAGVTGRLPYHASGTGPPIGLLLSGANSLAFSLETMRSNRSPGCKRHLVVLFVHILPVPRINICSAS
jgi:hypothetical protein